MAPPARRPTGRARNPGPWKHGPIPVIGVVGGIGSGKSAAAARFADLGAFVIDADKVGHALLSQRPVRERVVSRFGPAVLDANVAEGGEPAVDRRALGRVVFSDPAALRALEAIVHPRMRRTFEKAIARTVRRGVAKAVVLDAAILFEAGWDALCDRVVFVDAPRAARLERLSAERGWDEATLDARETSQASLEPKRARADLVLANDGGPEALAAGALRAWGAVLASRPARPARVERTPPSAPHRRPERPGRRAGGGPRFTNRTDD